MDKIFIHNLHLNTIIGIKDHEKYNKQPIILDLDLEINSKLTAERLDLKYSVDYDQLTKWLKEICENKSFGLIESLAEYLADNIIKLFHVPWLRLKITKPNAISVTKEVGLVIERSRV